MLRRPIRGENASVRPSVMTETRREAGGCPQTRAGPNRSRVLPHCSISTSHPLPSGRKSRPVAIFSTTLQPYCRCHLNAACAVCARNNTNAERRGKGKTNPNEFESSLPADVPGIVSAGSEPLFLRVWRIHREGEGTGTTRRKRGVSSNCVLDAPKAKLVESYLWTGRLALANPATASTLKPPYASSQ